MTRFGSFGGRVQVKVGEIVERGCFPNGGSRSCKTGEFGGRLGIVGKRQTRRGRRTFLIIGGRGRVWDGRRGKMVMMMRIVGSATGTHIVTARGQYQHINNSVPCNNTIKQ